jgi:N-acetylmuramoyl-L-alanine amidase
MLRRATRKIVIHCSATRKDRDIGAADIDELHRSFGWKGIGYHAVIRRDGLIEWGRHMDEQGAHVAGHNTDSVAVCLIGGLQLDGTPGEAFFDTFTDEQDESLRAVLRVLELAYPGAKVVGHRDLSPDLNGDGIIQRREWLKACPTFDVASWLAAQRFVDAVA